MIRSQRGISIASAVFMVVAIIYVTVLVLSWQAKASTCPAGTYFVREADACVYGVRPWEH